MLRTFWPRGQHTIGKKKPAHYRPRLEALEDRCLLSGGVLDPTFGSGGVVSNTAGGLNSARALATYPNAGTVNDGKVVAVGDVNVSRGINTYSEFAVVRYNLNGTLDTSFGGTGEVTTILTRLNQGGEACDVAIQPDGKIVVAGYAGNGNLALVRYNANGSLDTTFGGNGTGIVLTSVVTGTYNFVDSLALQPNGDIVVAGAGIFSNSGAATNPALVRYTAGGLLDSSFGTGGIVIAQFPYSLHLGPTYVNWFDLALDTSPSDPNAGKIVVVTRLVVTNQGGAAVVARYNSNGSLDTSFGGGAGYKLLTNLDTVPSVAIQSNGDIIVAAINHPSNPAGTIGLDCLNSDGSFNTTFGSGGIAVVSSPNVGYDTQNVTIQSDGKIVVAGIYGGNSSQDFFVARFNWADGSLDTSFGAGGVGTVTGTIGGSAVGLALDPDGRIVVCGTGGTGTATYAALARFVAYGPHIGSFTASPNPATAGSNLTLTAINIADEIPSATITQVTFYYVDSSGTKQVLGNGTQTSPGVWTLTFTVNLVSGTYTVYAQAEDSYGVFGDPFAITLTVQ
jgi:uncharacterized delta-60 repeat protein